MKLTLSQDNIDEYYSIPIVAIKKGTGTAIVCTVRKPVLSLNFRYLYIVLGKNNFELTKKTLI